MTRAVSCSQMRSFYACRKQYKYKKDHAPATATPIWMTMGSYAHKFFEVWGKECKATGTPDCMDHLLVVTAKAYKEASIAAIQSGQPLLMGDEWQALCEDILHPWAQRTSLDWSQVQGIEIRFALTRAGNSTDFEFKSAYFRGIFDRLEQDDKGHIVRDYKTGYSGKADLLQADCYAWMMMNLFPNDTEWRVIFEHVAQGFDEVMTYTPDMFDDLDRNMRLNIDTIRSTTVFPASPGYACMDCPYADICDERPVGIKEVLETEQDAKNAVEAYASLSRTLTNLKSALERWYDVHGDIEHNGVTWKKWPVQSDGFYDVPEFIDRMRARGLDPMPCLKVDNVKAKKYRRILRELITTGRFSMRFEGRKTQEVDYE